MNFLAQKRPKILSKDTFSAPPAFSNPKKSLDFYYKEVANLTAAGGWRINFVEKTSFLDAEARHILKIPSDYSISLKSSLEFFAPEFRKEIIKAFFEGSLGKAYTGTVKMLTYDKEEIWTRVTSKPIYNKNNGVTGLQGIFQDITDLKQNEFELKHSLKVIESQNTRLFNFANIISHNLRSHASNLHLTLDLLNTADSKEEESELKEGLSVISNSINTAIDHLNDIVSIQTNAKDDKNVVPFRESLLRVQHSLQNIIFDSEAEIYSDFSEAPSIKYIPAYLESIFLNLISNAIKFKHPDRIPVIDICSYKEGENKFLMIKDNGIGMDLAKFGNRIFNMYQTFQRQEDSKGVGLFMTKNQVEAMGGSIDVSSVVNEGTTFTIKF